MDTLWFFDQFFNEDTPQQGLSFLILLLFLILCVINLGLFIQSRIKLSQLTSGIDRLKEALVHQSKPYLHQSYLNPPWLWEFFTHLIQGQKGSPAPQVSSLTLIIRVSEVPNLSQLNLDQEFSPLERGMRWIHFNHPPVQLLHLPFKAQSSFPAILTMMGILGTFWGIYHTLQGLNFNLQDMEGLRAMSGKLLTGMKGAFGTSLLGLGSALILMLGKHIAYLWLKSRLDQQIARLHQMGQVDSIFQSIHSLDLHVQQMIHNQAEMNIALTDVLAQMSLRLVEINQNLTSSSSRSTDS